MEQNVFRFGFISAAVTLIAVVVVIVLKISGAFNRVANVRSYSWKVMYLYSTWAVCKINCGQSKRAKIAAPKNLIQLN